MRDIWVENRDKGRSRTRFQEEVYGIERGGMNGEIDLRSKDWWD